MLGQFLFGLCRVRQPERAALLLGTGTLGRAVQVDGFQSSPLFSRPLCPVPCAASGEDWKREQCV